ncbi:MAG: magnesium transporter [Methanosarcinales archaeon]|jgi:magnesium transporter|nr:magnesium transporter [Methanosarcinales archaeon]
MKIFWDISNKSLFELVEEKITSREFDSLKSLLNSSGEMEVLNVIRELTPESQAIVFRLLSKDAALFIFEQLDTSDQQNLIRSFTEEDAIEMIEELSPDVRVRLLDELPAKVAKKMLAALSPEERQATNLLMGYEPQKAGRIMTPEYVRLYENMTGAEALETVKEIAKDKETIYTLYVVDNTRKLVGVLSLRELLTANPSDKIAAIMKTHPVAASTDTDQEEVARLLQKLNLLAIPIVDKENRLVGIITVDDAIDILEEESTEGMFSKAGIADLTKNEAAKSEVLVSGSVWSIWKVRLPFLILTLAGGLLAGGVIGSFEAVLESIIIVAIFIPVIMDMGGNVGIQSSTVFLRGFILGHIKEETLWKHIAKEVWVGLTMGVFVGVVAGIGISVWQIIWGDGIWELGLAVGLTLAIIMTFASFLGYIIPYALMRLNIDQAAGTDPIITTIKDITGLLAYFVLVSIFLSHLL